MEVKHTIEPVFDHNSKILILGTMPSVKSREAGFFYMHPQNLFWKIVSEIIGVLPPTNISDRKQLLLKSGIALWDVLETCDIEGSSDSSIKMPIANDFSKIFSIANINAVFTTGTKATELYHRLCSIQTGKHAIHLPSTSPANRKYYTYESLLKSWSIIKKYL